MVDRNTLDNDKLNTFFLTLDKAIDESLSIFFEDEITYDSFFNGCFKENMDEERDEDISPKMKDYCLNGIAKFERYNLNEYYKCDDEEHFELAVKQGLFEDADPNDMLMLAIKGNSFRYIKEALNLGADINISKYYLITWYEYLNRFTPLKYACTFGNIHIIKYLIELGAEILIFEDDIVCSTLHVASMCGHLEVVKFLIESGIDVNYPSRFEHPPLLDAMYQGTFEVSKYLLENGADANCELNDTDTCLHHASWKKSLIYVKLLMEYGADVNHQSSTGDAPLHYAIEEENIDVVRFLVEHGANIDMVNESGETPLDIARRKNYPDLIQYFE